MSSWPTVSALDSRTQTFPVLTDAQISRLRAIGKTRSVEVGDVLFQPGDTNIPFFVLLSGRMEIVQPGFHGERPITTHAPGEFTGEVSMISGQRCLVLGRVTEPGEFLELNSQELRSVIACCSTCTTMRSLRCGRSARCLVFRPRGSASYTPPRCSSCAG